MADIKQIKVGDTTYNIEPVTSYYKVGRPDFEMNSSGSLKGYGGFIDFHFFNSSGQPLNSSGSVVSSTPDYTSRIIEDSAGCININGTYISWTGLTSGYIKSNGSIDATTFNENGTSLIDKYVTIGTSQTISGLKTFKGNESNDISFVYNGNKTISGYGNHTAIRHALSFPWYNDIYQIGNIRGDSADSLGFGITKGNNELVARFVDTSNAYIGNNKIIHSGNFVSGNSSNGEHNANNAITNGHYYYNSNGPATSLGASYTDGALYVQSHSSNWVGQIAQDYRNGSLFVRGKNNGSWQSWKRVIDSDNIGSQSVKYASSSHLLRTYSASDTSHGEDYYLKCRHNVDGNERFKLQIVRSNGSVTHSTSVDYANYAGSANYFNYGRGAILANSSSFTNNFCKDIFGEENNNNYHLVALRTNSQAPSCLLGDYSSGIAWKGSDTYGSLMVRYNTSEIRVSGGNGANSNPKWTVDLVHSGNIGSQNVNYANSAGSVAWGNVTGKPTNFVTTDTAQTISGAKTFSNTITANNWLYVPYIGTKTNKLYIEGPWNGAGQEQPTLTFEDGALKAYNWEDDGESVYESMFDFRFPYGVQMSASGASIYLNGNTNCYLQSTAKGWMVDGSDQYGCIYPAANHNGKIGLSANHFYQGYINYIYSCNIAPIAYNGSSATYNYGSVGTTNNYFGSGAFKTVYRTSESGISDVRLKQNISNNDLNALNIINNLNIINFQYDDDIKIEARNKKQRLKAINTMKELPKTKETKELRKELQKIIATPNNEDMITIGVSAQQLQELLPKKYQKTFIQKESTNQYADQLFIRENRLVYLSFKAIQEQQAIIGSLEEKINLLEEKINALEEKMKKEVN